MVLKDGQMNILGWPFVITVDGNVAARKEGRLIIDFATLPTEEVVDQVAFAVESFVALAEAGGLGGDRLEPHKSTVILSTDSATTDGTALVWELTLIAIDPRGLAVLFNMLSFLGKGIRAVTVQSVGSGPDVPFSTGDFPPIWPDVPFEMDDDRTGPNVEVQIEFVREVPPELRETVIDAVEAWQNCGMVHGYRDWTEPEDRSFLIPLSDPTFEFIDEDLIGQFQDDGLVEGCYDIFFNILMKLHATTQIRSVDVV